MTTEGNETDKRPPIPLYIPPPRRQSSEPLSDLGETCVHLRSPTSQPKFQLKHCQGIPEDLLFNFSHICLNEAANEEKLNNGLFVFENEKRESSNLSSTRYSNTNSAKNVRIDLRKLGHIIELYDFPANADTISLQSELYGFADSGFILKWVDDTHCLAVFSSVTEATQALKQVSGILMKARPVEDACMASKMKIAKSPGDWAMPFKKRPPSDSSVASRLISFHLGMTPKPTSPEAIQARNVARERERERRRNKKAMWEDD